MYTSGSELLHGLVKYVYFCY